MFKGSLGLALALFLFGVSVAWASPEIFRPDTGPAPGSDKEALQDFFPCQVGDRFAYRIDFPPDAPVPPVQFRTLVRWVGEDLMVSQLVLAFGKIRDAAPPPARSGDPPLAGARRRRHLCDQHVESCPRAGAGPNLRGLCLSKVSRYALQQSTISTLF